MSEMSTQSRACHLCEAICGVEIKTRGDQIVSIKGDKMDPFSRGHICPKAIAIQDIHNDPDRLRQPLQRVGRNGSSQWEPISWEVAFKRIGEQLNQIQWQYGRDAVAFFAGNPNVHNFGSMTHLAPLLRLFKTRNLYSATSLDQLPVKRETHARLIQVQEERTAASMRFFAENTDKFREQQDLIASYPVYAEQVRELLLNTPLPATDCALEIGPGEGEFLAVLAPRFDKVIALDNASSMLEKASRYAGGCNLTNIEFICGETTLARELGLSADCVVINMVLHHISSPADVFQDISCILKPGGALLVTDLCHHDQNWTREACGDIWLGFEPEDFSNWAATSGLHEGQSVYFALRNGFQIQLRQFFKPKKQ
ncbi:MAG: methyltransferase domain-containing protein [Exilibacterium sp.]